MTRTTLLRCALILPLAAALLAQPAARRVIKIDDMHAFRDVRDLQISPDGKWVAYSLSTVDATADKSDSDIWMASWDGAQQLRMTSSTEAENAPRWSPDGRYLSFTSSRPGKARGSQVWLLDRSGGEAQQFTDVKGRLSSYEWSPDSKRLLLVMADRDPDAPDEDRPAPVPAAGGANAKAPKPIVIDRYKFKQDVVGYLTQKPPRIYLYDMGAKKAEALTAETLEAASPSWSPDGKSIAFLGKEGKDAERYNTWNVYVIEARAGAAPRQITHYDGVHSSASRSRPEWSPDGSRLVYLQSSGASLNAYNMNRVAVVPMAGGAPKILAEKLDRGAAAPRFTRDGASILFLVADDRWEYPALVPANGGEVERLVKGPGTISTIEQGKDGRFAVMAASDTAHGEIHALENGKLRPLTHHNDALMA